jgi:hypothetical protein
MKQIENDHNQGQKMSCRKEALSLGGSAKTAAGGKESRKNMAASKKIFNYIWLNACKLVHFQVK